MKISKYSWILVFVTILLVLLQLYVMIGFADSTGHTLPDTVNFFAVTYKQSNDVFLSVPNFFLIPLFMLIFNVFFGRKQTK